MSSDIFGYDEKFLSGENSQHSGQSDLRGVEELNRQGGARRCSDLFDSDKAMLIFKLNLQKH